MTSATQSLSPARAPADPNKAVGEGGDTQTARLAYAAFEALVSADVFGREPLLHREAAAKREQARINLAQALARLETVQ